MKMVYVGSLATRPDRDAMWIREFERLGWNVTPFSSKFIDSDERILTKIRRRFGIGKSNQLMQRALVEVIKRVEPSWVHFRLPIEFDSYVIQAIKKVAPIVTEYFNDDPYSNVAPFGIYWKFHKVLPLFDLNFVYRVKNIKEFYAHRANHVIHCPPTFDQERLRHSGPLDFDSLISDVAFIGHWEDDWRLDCLLALHNRGIKVIVKGGGWNAAVKGTALEKLLPIQHAFNEEYNYIYSHSCLGLCFFSKINNDTWTERALEIVAVGGVLLCERTEEAISYFKDREEAFFFSSVDELIDIVLEVKSNFELREKVCVAGYRRLCESRNSVQSRAVMIERTVQATLSKIKLSEQ